MPQFFIERPIFAWVIAILISLGGIIAASMLSGRAMAPLGQVAGLLMQYHNARTSLTSIEIGRAHV